MTQIREGGVEIPADQRVLIWSGEHQAYWRPNAQGYVTVALAAGVYSRAEAERLTSHCGPEKDIQIKPVPADFPPVAYTPTPSPEIADPFTTARNDIAGLPGHGMSADVQVAEQPMGEVKVYHLGAALQGIADEHADILRPRQTKALYDAAALVWEKAATPRPTDPTSVAGEGDVAVERMREAFTDFIAAADAGYVSVEVDKAARAALATNAPDAAKREGRP